MQLKGLIQQLSEPFPVECVIWKAEDIEGDTASAMPYATLRVYEDRLNQEAGDWQSETQFLPAANRLVCTVRLSIEGVTRSGDGEAKLSDENAATAAYAQAFKRACSRFGLGRFLYDLPLLRVAYQADQGQFAPQALAQLQDAYRRYTAGEAQAFTGPDPGPAPQLQTSQPDPEQSAPLEPPTGQRSLEELMSASQDRDKGSNGRQKPPETTGPDPLAGLRARAREYKMDLGRHAGRSLGQIQDEGHTDYLAWVAGRRDIGGKHFQARNETQRRLQSAAAWLVDNPALTEPAACT